MFRPGPLLASRRRPSVRRWLAVGPLAACVIALGGTAVAAEFDVDRAHLAVHFAVGHYDISYVRGRFARIDAKVQFDPEARNGAVGVTVDAGSIDTGNA